MDRARIHTHTVDGRAIIIGEKTKEGKPVRGEGGAQVALDARSNRFLGRDTRIVSSISFRNVTPTSCRSLIYVEQQHSWLNRIEGNGGGSSPINWSINSELWVIVHNIVNKGVRSKIRVLRIIVVYRAINYRSEYGLHNYFIDRKILSWVESVFFFWWYTVCHQGGDKKMAACKNIYLRIDTLTIMTRRIE